MGTRLRRNDWNALALTGYSGKLFCDKAAFLLPPRKPAIVAGARRVSAPIKQNRKLFSEASHGF